MTICRASHINYLEEAPHNWVTRRIKGNVSHSGEEVLLRHVCLILSQLNKPAKDEIGLDWTGFEPAEDLGLLDLC